MILERVGKDIQIRFDSGETLDVFLLEAVDQISLQTDEKNEN